MASCPPFPEAKFRWYVTTFLDPFVTSCQLFGDMWMFCHRIFPNTLAMSSRLFSKVRTFCRIIFWTFVMSCHLLSKLWTFCHRIFSTHLPCPAGFSAKCVHLLHLFLLICDVQWPAQQTADVLSQHLWKNTDGAVRRKKSKKSHETVLLNDL